jgi:hypothetical protein
MFITGIPYNIWSFQPSHVARLLVSHVPEFEFAFRKSIERIL